MKTIALTRGAFAIVDDGDYEELSKYRWQLQQGSRGHRYAKRSEWDKEQKKYFVVFMHRQILGLKRGEKTVVDHVNDNGLDNRRANIRVATVSQNTARARRHRPVRGAHFHRGRWFASITHERKSIHLGCFDTEEQAGEAYKQAALRIHGEFARLENDG